MDNRRKFLKALIFGGAVAAAALAAGPAFASGDGDRYRRLINSQLTIIKAHELKGKYVGTPAGSKARDVVDRNVCNLFKILHYDFNGKAELQGPKRDMLYRKVSQIFNRELVIDTLSEADLDRYENTLIAIATARYLLAHRRITFDPGKVPHWDSFSDAYQDIIIKA